MKDASSMNPAAGSFTLVESEQPAGRLDYQLAELIEFVRIQYAVALNRYVSLGVVSYSGPAG
jgi:hypothetical protein